MSALLSARGIAEKALEKIGAYSINDTAADGEELVRALSWLDLIVAEVAGNERCFWLVPATIDVPLTADTASYDLESTMGTSAPADGVLYPVGVKLRDANDEDEPVEIIHRDAYEAIADKDASGTPDRVYFDRLNSAGITAYVYPVPTVSTYSLQLVVQTHAPDLTLRSGGIAHNFPVAWQRCLITLLAGAIGDGPVRRLQSDVLRDIKGEGEALLNRLLARENREHAPAPQVAMWD